MKTCMRKHYIIRTERTLNIKKITTQKLLHLVKFK